MSKPIVGIFAVACCLSGAAHARPIASHDRTYQPLPQVEGQSYYTVLDAPDATSVRVLSLWSPTMSGAKQDHAKLDAYGIHRSFAQVIEQNFARLHPAQAQALIGNMSDLELQDLGGLYDQSVADTGHSAVLSDLLGTRLDAAALNRVAAAFAAARAATIANGGRAVTMFDGAQKYPAPPEGNWLDYTPQEIYLDLRTSVIGSRSIAAALLETGTYIGRNVFMAYWAGYTAGTLLNDVIVRYDPQLEDDIGGMIYNAVDWITTDGSSWWNYGRAQQWLGEVFNYDHVYGVPIGYANSIELGDDYSSSFGWDMGYDMGGFQQGGGGGGSCWPSYCDLR